MVTNLIRAVLTGALVWAWACWDMRVALGVLAATVVSEVSALSLFLRRARAREEGSDGE